MNGYERANSDCLLDLLCAYCKHRFYNRRHIPLFHTLPKQDVMHTSGTIMALTFELPNQYLVITCTRSAHLLQSITKGIVSVWVY